MKFKHNKITYARGDFDRAYPRESEWIAFVESIEKLRWEPECNFKDELIYALDGDTEIAIAVFAVAGNESISWIDQEGGEVLGYLSPKECLALGLRGRLQTALITFPYL